VKKTLAMILVLMMVLCLSTAAMAESYDMAPRKVEGTLKVALIPVTINTSYTMTINGAKAYIADKG